MLTIDIIGYAAGFFLMWSFLPQLIKTYKTHKAEDISITMLCITLISAILYEIYAVMLQLTPVIIMNGIFSFTILLQLIITIILKMQADNRASKPTK
ncbi:SemiSWEET family sugar transporter [Pseudomonadota bacterium]